MKVQCLQVLLKDMWVTIAHSFLLSVSNLFHFIISSLPKYVALHIAAKEFLETHF